MYAVSMPRAKSSVKSEEDTGRGESYSAKCSKNNGESALSVIALENDIRTKSKGRWGKIQIGRVQHKYKDEELVRG